MITVEILKEKMFNFAYHEALTDATGQKAYEGEKSVIENNEKAKSVVRAYIDSLLDENTIPISFSETTQSVAKAIKDENFTFGNIQKLINMTVKYIYLGCYSNPELRKKFERCDCPMDSVMIRKVFKEFKENYVDKHKGDEKFIIIPYGNGKKGYDKSKISWSKIVADKNDNITSRTIYDNYQKMARIIAEDKGIYPIELDYVLWG